MGKGPEHTTFEQLAIDIEPLESALNWAISLSFQRHSSSYVECTGRNLGSIVYEIIEVYFVVVYPLYWLSDPLSELNSYSIIGGNQ